MDMGIDKPNAVNADNCCGEKFFEAGIVISYELQGTSQKLKVKSKKRGIYDLKAF